MWLSFHLQLNSTKAMNLGHVLNCDMTNSGLVYRLHLLIHLMDYFALVHVANASHI